MTNICQEKKEFRTTVLCLKLQNPRWNACETATFLEQSEKPPLFSRSSLRKKITRTLNRGSVEDKNRPGSEIKITLILFINEKLKESIVKSDFIILFSNRATLLIVHSVRLYHLNRVD